jgi:hypothetical protein
MNSTRPALVTQRAAQRLPRTALLLLCAIYLVPGLVGRDPWKGADITAFGYMLSMAEGRASWVAPAIGGVAADAVLWPYWLGAASISALSPWVDAPLAARLPFAALLGLVMALVWYGCFHLARTEAAQPVAFAFGGEAETVDYARAISDGALLALLATLGLLQLGHETTPELGQLLCAALFLYALAASPFRLWRARAAAVGALALMAAGGAPTMAVAMGLVGCVICLRSRYPRMRIFAAWVLAATATAAALAWALGLWSWRLPASASARDAVSAARLLLWFTWPAWPLAAWTVWRWRRQFTRRHIAVPLGLAACSIVASVLMGGADRALLLALPALAVLAAFALPTLRRSAGSAIDWFSVFFFSVSALAVWVIYIAMHTGVPAKPAANVAKLAPGFDAPFSWVALLAAAAGTLAWLWLVRWRTARHQHALWKSLVLPAGGVALTWLLLMSLWLPLLDYGRSYRPLVARIAQHVPAGSCIAAAEAPRHLQAALEYFGRFEVDGARDPDDSRCAYRLAVESARRARTIPQGWTLVARERRPTDREEQVALLRRQPGAAP